MAGGPSRRSHESRHLLVLTTGVQKLGRWDDYWQCCPPTNAASASSDMEPAGISLVHHLLQHCVVHVFLPAEPGFANKDIVTCMDTHMNISEPMSVCATGGLQLMRLRALL